MPVKKIKNSVENKKQSELQKMMEADSGPSAPAGESDLGAISDLAKRQVAIEDEIVDLEARLSDKAKELIHISQTELPEAMSKVGMLAFSLDTGEKINIKSIIAAHISREREAQAFAWLKKINADSLIKNVIKTAFGKGETNKAEALVKILQKSKYKFEQKQSVNANSLSAFVRERLEGGLPVDMELLGVVDIKVSKITRP